MTTHVASAPVSPSAKPRRPLWRHFQFDLTELLLFTLLCAAVATLLIDAFKNARPRRGDVVPIHWDAVSGDNIKWQAQLGSQTFSTPRIHGGKVFIGSNNGAGWIQRYPKEVDLGVLLCFDAETGKFLWQHSVQKLPSGIVNDWPMIGIPSTPHAEGERLWYATNRCEIVCLDTEGFRDGENDGPYQSEEVKGPREADVIWKFDMMARLKVYPHNMTRCDITAAGDLLFINTCNGVDESHVNVPSPQSPNFLAMSKNTGQVVWSDNSVGENLLHGAWASPVYAVLGGAPQVLFPGGDGWLYSFDPAGAGKGGAKLLWRFDCNPKTSKWLLGGRGDRNNCIASPVIYKDRVYIAAGHNPEHGEGQGRLWCLDPTRRGDISPTLVFNRKEPAKPIAHKRLQACELDKGDFERPNPNSAVIFQYDKFDANGNGKIEFEEEMHRTISRPAVAGGLLFISDSSGLVHCIDADTGRPHWTYDCLAAIWSSPLIAGQYVYACDEDGDAAVFRLSANPSVAMPGGAPLREINMGSSIWSTPVVDGNVLYWATRNHLFAIQDDEHQ